MNMHASFNPKDFINQALNFLRQTVFSEQSQLCSDSRLFKLHDVFVAYRMGSHIETANYHFLEKILSQNPSAILADIAQIDIIKNNNLSAEQLIQLKTIPYLCIENLYQHLGKIAHHFYENNQAITPIIGITGTNGKTSISTWLAQALSHLNTPLKTGLIGTLGSGIFPDLQLTGFTTPDALRLQKSIQHLQKHANVIAMEVSSHGLDQYRCAGIDFFSATFSNLTQDHLDYHGSLESYQQAKAKLFLYDNLEYAILNINDAFSQQLADITTAKKRLFYGFEDEHLQQFIANQGLRTGDGLIIIKNYCYSHAKYTIDIHIELNQQQENYKCIEDTLTTHLIGDFNLSNLLAVIANLLSLNLNWADIKQAIAFIVPVCGRLEKILPINQNNQSNQTKQLPLVLVDYAHTPDALDKTLATLHQLINKANQGKLICVFGCGGNRDAFKRPLMLEAVKKHADSIIITDDNPRYEDPQAIVKDILSNQTSINTSVQVIHSRANAIETAIKNANCNDIILIAGKGHETYQEIKGQKYVFSDQDVASACLLNYLQTSINQ